MNSEETLQAIYQVEKDLEYQLEALKEFKNDFEDQLSELPSYEAAQKAKEEYKKAHSQLKREARTNSNIALAQENLAKIKADIKDLRDILGLHLARFHFDTGGDMVPLESEPTILQPVTIVAKLGKKVRVKSE